MIENHRSVSADKYGEQAAMSYVHFLAIPKCRIFNCVTLHRDHVPMLQRIMLRVKQLYLNDDFRSYLSDFAAHLSDDIISAEFLEFYCHPYPMSGIGQLCIHCLQSNLWTKTKSKTAERNLVSQRGNESQ